MKKIEIRVSESLYRRLVEMARSNPACEGNPAEWLVKKIVDGWLEDPDL